MPEKDEVGRMGSMNDKDMKKRFKRQKNVCVLAEVVENQAARKREAIIKCLRGMEGRKSEAGHRPL